MTREGSAEEQSRRQSWACYKYHVFATAEATNT